MIIDSVLMKNFKSHRETLVEFGPGINVILGENGAGKTSVLEAISFALFKDYAGSVDGLVRTGAVKMEVSVTFSSGGRKYRVMRKRTKSGTESRLFLVDGSEKELRSGDSGVDEEVSAILGIDKYLFGNAIYVRQGEIEKLLTDTPFKKKQLIGKLLGIEVLEKVWELMKPLTDSYRERRAVAEGQIMKEEEITRRKGELEGELSEVRERMGKTRKKIEDTQLSLSGAVDEEKALMEAETRYAGLEVKRNETGSMLSRESERLSSSRKRLSDASKAGKEIRIIGKRLPSGWKHELEKKISSMRKRESEIDSMTGSLSGRIAEMKELRDKLQAIGGKCPLCGSDLTEGHRKKLLLERKEKLSSMEKEYSSLASEKRTTEKELEKLAVKMEELSSLEKRKIELIGMSGLHEDLRKAVADGEKITSELSGKLKAIEAEMKGSEAATEAYRKAQERVSSLRSELEALKEAYGRQQGKLQELEKSLEIAEKEASDVKEKKEEHGRLAEFIVLLNEIRGVFDKSGLQLELRKRAVPAIESHVREFFREFNFEYSDISLTQDYDISLHGPGGETTTGMMSGGEKIAAALALRLGIARTLAGPSAETVMLDEPTIFLDEQRRQDLIEVLRKMSVMPQMIVVTHDLAMEDAADSIVIVKKEKGVSCVGG